MVELYCPNRMTAKRVVMVIASLWIHCDCQSFTNVSEKQDVLLGANVSMIWIFDAGSGSFETGLWSNPQGSDVMSKFRNEMSETLPGFETKVVPYGEYGMTVLNVMEEDSGAYTAVFAFDTGGASVPIEERAYFKVHNVSVPLDFVMYIEGNSTNNTESGATVNVTVVAPPNDPPSINVSITIYTDKKSVSRDWPNSDETMPRSLDFEVPSHKWLKIEACLSHPAVSNETCKEEQFTIQDPNTLTSSLAPDDTSVSTDTPPSTEDPHTLTSSLAPDDASVSTDTIEDPSITQPSSSPTVTTSDDLTPDPQSDWSHWYILLIALGCIVILVVIAVVIHRRAQRKDDDLDAVTELKPPSVHAAPADHVRANTADYRPSQHQQPRREDNTAYYVQGTSVARL